MRRTWAAAALVAGAALLSGCGGRTAAPETGPAPKEPQAGTGAVETLPESTLAGRHVESIVELLEGQVAGLQVVRLPNGAISLRIRGDVALVAGSREPLLVIDDMPVAPGNIATALESLRPHEIDRIRVLKDVASTAVYGTRGAHGVILIVTKRD